MSSITLTVREWSRATPDNTPTLRGLTLTAMDRELLAALKAQTSLRVEELRQGLAIEIGPHIGAVTLSCLHLTIVPKLRLDTLLGMVAYAFELADLALTDIASNAVPAVTDFVDLLALSLLRAAERIVRLGLLALYQERQEELATPRGRIDMRFVATRPRQPSLRCEFHELTIDHGLNRALAAGLRRAALLARSHELRRALAWAAVHLVGDHRPSALTGADLKAAGRLLDRRSGHYRTALSLTALLFQGGALDIRAQAGGLPAVGFLLDMNRVFERFLTRYLQQHAPPGVEVTGQETRRDVFAYLDNPAGWRQPAIRPDLVFREQGRAVAVGDAKYRDHGVQPPATEELFQLVAYGLAYAMPEPREVLLFYPLAADAAEQPARLLFTPAGAAGKVQARLIGAPLDRLLAGERWWPLSIR